jgi:two-component system response regulator AtoC
MPVDDKGLIVLLGEEDLDVRIYLETAFRCQGYSVEVVQSAGELLPYLQSNLAPVSAVVLDITMPGRDGIGALTEIRRLDRTVPILMISGVSTDMVEAMKQGADAFIAKPINPDDLRKALKKAVEVKAHVGANVVERAAPPARDQVFSSSSPRMRELQILAPSVGRSLAPVLIQGETGVGKEVLARQLHAYSPRAKRRMLKLNCAALPSELVESELFGYERGAFTGAFQKKPGMFELADGGTIMLDEIGDMDFRLQAKLLQVLQDSEFQRLGGKDTIRVDVRVIAATHCDLEKRIADDRFREDLYYRLNVVSLRVPPLRERKDDIIALADFFVRKHAEPGTAIAKIPPLLQELFLEYQWPGNVRELENLVRRFLIFPDAGYVEQYLRSKLVPNPANEAVLVETLPAAEPPQIDVPLTPANATNGIDRVHGTNGVNGHMLVNGEFGGVTPVLVQVANAKREAERAVILDALRATKWNRRQASVRLETDYKSLLYKMKVLSIKKEKAVAVGLTDSRAIAASARQ